MKKLYKFEKENTLRLELFPDWDMAWVFLNDKNIYTGNYWDYHPGCHGGRVAKLAELYGHFSRPAGFVSALKKHIVDCDCTVVVEEKIIDEDRAEEMI